MENSSFSINRSITVLEKTPATLNELLRNLSDFWIQNNEGGETWSPFDIVGHLLHGEKTDWIDRMNIILSDSGNKTFTPFDRFAQFKSSEGMSLVELLEEFSKLRSINIQTVKDKNLQESDLSKRGIHPSFGEVTLKELIATWVAHDLSHIAQISRVMAHQYKEEVGPWKEFLRILNS